MFSFKEFLVEINKIRQYYKDNPDKIYKDKVPEKANVKQEYKRGSGNLDKLFKEFKEKYPEAVEFAKIDTYHGYNSGFKNLLDAINLGHGYDYEKYVKPLEKNPEYLNLFKKYAKKYEAMKNQEFNKIKKIALSRGLKGNDVTTIMNWVEHYTSMSGRKIPKEVWPALRKLTVNDNELPKTIYRGLFIDGAKIKDDKKWSQYKQDDKIKLTVSKASSWTSSKSVATQFMDPQSNVKDEKNGYYLLLKYKIKDPTVVIADFRSLPELKFWNQQEILLNPEVKEFEIEQIIHYEGKENLSKYVTKNIKPGAGAFGQNKINLILNNYLNLNKLDIPKDIKEKWKTYYNKTVGDLIQIEPAVKEYISKWGADYAELLKQVNLSEWAGLRVLSFEIDSVTNPNTVVFYASHQTKNYKIINYTGKLKLTFNSAQNRNFVIFGVESQDKEYQEEIIDAIMKKVDNFNKINSFAKVSLR